MTALACDGQVTLGTTVLKHGASKLRRLAGGRVLAGFAGSVADALALFTRFEAKLEEFGINLERAAVELARKAVSPPHCTSARSASMCAVPACGRTDPATWQPAC